MLPSMTSAGATDEAPDEAPVILVNDTELKIFRLCLHAPISRKEILAQFGHKTLSGNMKQALKRLKDKGLIDHTIEDKPNSKHQQYKITTEGKKYLDYSTHTSL